MTLRHRILPSKRRHRLKQLLSSRSGIRIIEAHNGLSGLIGATTVIQDNKGVPTEFDGLWISSLTDSAAKGHPDTEVIDTSSRLQTIQEILQVTDKPIIVDGDTGGEATQFEYFCSKLENLGVSAVIIEDKKYPKRNSLEKDAIQNLEDPDEFATKVNRAKEICLSDDFMIFTRIESFIAGRGLDDAIQRASIYLDSKADGIFIHSNAKNTDQIYAFMDAYQKLCKKKGLYKPVVCVPTTYNEVTDTELFKKGFSIVIYANHQLRAAYKSMQTVCESILTNHRSFESNNAIAPISDVMEKVGFPDVKSKDIQYTRKPLPVVILGAGKPEGFVGTPMETLPVSSIPIAGQTLLQHQVATLKELQLNDITVVTGYARDMISDMPVSEINNTDFTASKVANSLMMASEKLSKGFVMMFGDVIFDKKLLSNYVLEMDSDILLLVDNSFNLMTRKNIKPTTDLVILADEAGESLRKPNMVTEAVSDIGCNVPVEKATHEFIGIAKFTARGFEFLQKKYNELNQKSLDFNTLIKALIDDGVQVDAIAVNQGWSEVHTMSDVAAIEKGINRRNQKLQEYV